MEKVPSELVTKLDAAERQLRVAIRLFFERRDLIAIHTLAAAAQEIVRQLGKARGLKGMYEHANERIRPEKRKEFINELRAAQKFFKHAGKDANQKLEFHYEATKFQLFDAVLLCAALKGLPLAPEFAAFLGWFMAKYPDVFIDEGDPIMAAVEQLVRDIDFDDFELIICAIDALNRDTKTR
jgi:hypothetical protein